jgi:hypothetical protein
VLFKIVMVGVFHSSCCKVTSLLAIPAAVFPFWGCSCCGMSVGAFIPDHFVLVFAIPVYRFGHWPNPVCRCPDECSP